jgi:hypothetical protein
MQIIVTYDSDVANAPTGFKACVNAACQYLDALLTDPITVRVDVGYGTLAGQPLDSGALGESSGSFQFVNYSSAVSKLQAKGTAGASTLPASAPNGDSLVLSTAQVKALGFVARGGAVDGYVGFATGINWNFDPTEAKTLPFNSYDFVATVLHEVTEVLGRISFLDQSGQVALLDLFRYASAGNLQGTTNGPSYFSVDGGVTHQLAFNNFQTGDQGDLGDWATANRTNDSFNDDSFNGVINAMSGTDKTELQAIGFSETAASQALSVAGSVPQVTAADAVADISGGQDAYVKVLDSGSGVSASLDGLEALAKGQYLSGISLSGGSSITLSIAQITSDADALKLISGSYTLSVADSAANIQANLATLQTDLSAGKISAAAVTDSSYAAITVTPAQLTADRGVIDLLTGNFTLAVNATSVSNVSITGPSGHGTVVDLSGSASQYSVSPTGDGVSFTLTNLSSGVDQISNITALSFGGTLDFVAAKPGPADAITNGNITELYGAAFGREPDVPGLAFYQAYLKANPSVGLTTYATYFLSSPEYTGNTAHNYAQTTAGDAQFITDCYQNLLHRTPSASEVSFYQGVIASYGVGTLQAHAQVVTYFSQSPEFLNDVQITSAHPADSSHWLYLI